jgi:hypothetical protein
MQTRRGAGGKGRRVIRIDFSFSPLLSWTGSLGHGKPKGPCSLVLTMFRREFSDTLWIWSRTADTFGCCNTTLYFTLNLGCSFLVVSVCLVLSGKTTIPTSSARSLYWDGVAYSEFTIFLLRGSASAILDNLTKPS